MSKIRLTKDMREEVVERVVRATNIPELKADIVARTKKAAAEIIRAAQPEGFYEKTEGLPKEWFDSASTLYIYPPGYAVLLAFGYSACVDLDDPVKIAAHGAAKYDFEPMRPLRAEADALAERERQLRGEIGAFLASCRYVEDVVERMPELEPHVPNYKKSFPLTAPSNLLSTLTSLGFDKTVRA